MKKLTSLLLALMMVLSVLSTFVVFTSAAGNDLLKTYAEAAEGDLLYKAKFGQTDGVFKSGVFAIGAKGDNENEEIFKADISDDGYTAKLTYKPVTDGKASSRRIYYGGAVEGLKYGSGEKYTIEYLVHDADTTSTTNYGVYYNFPETFAEEDPLKRTEYDHMLGWYGTPSKRGTLTIGGSKYTGKYISHDVDYITSQTHENKADGFHKVTIEVEDNAYRVYINNKFFDEGFVYDGQEKMAPNIGISVYLYNTQTFGEDTFIVKDVCIYKGHTVRNIAEYPDYFTNAPKPNPNSTNVLLKEYDKAADGELLYTVKMDAEDGVFVPKVLRDEKGVTITTADGTSVVHENTGMDSGYWWGDTIDGLSVTPETKYTMQLKVQSFINKNGGFGFVAVPGRQITRCYNYYGFFTEVEGTTSTPQTVIECGTGKIPGELLNTKDYTPIYPARDADGYLDVAVEVNGFKFTVYYKTNVLGVLEVEPYWTVFETYDMTPDLEYYGEASMCFQTYTHNNTTNWEAKDVNIYKGLTVTAELAGETGSTTEESKPADTSKEPDTTTKAPDVTTAAPSVTTGTPAGTEAPKEKGCGGMIAGGMAVIAIVALGAVAVSKKKD